MEKDYALKLTVLDIQQQTGEAKTIFFSFSSNEKVSYKPGQFITLLLNLNEKPIRRSYSISFWADNNTFSITVKRVPNGEASRYLLDHLQVGDRLKALAPAGRFVYEAKEGHRDLFLLAAGSGIGPMMPIIHQALKSEPQTKLHLLYSNSTVASTIFYKELNELASNQFEVDFLFSRTDDFPQRLNNYVLEKWISKVLTHLPEDALFYLCGPSDYMRMVGITLLFMGFKPAQILKEQFVIAAPVISESFVFRQTLAKALIKFRKQDYHIQIKPKQTILQSALENGIELPYSCNAGICATCAAKCIKGEVQMSQNQVLTDREVASGRILVCTAYPDSDILEIVVGD